MRGPFHDQVSLSRGERASFEYLRRRFGAVPNTELRDASLGWPTRLRLMAWSHPVALASLVPLGVAVMFAAVLSWWPAGLIGALLVAIGQLGVAELLRIRYLGCRIRLRGDPDLQSPSGC
ncbi:MAG: hypothetical protein OEV40_17240 [Acidimicrobiia bacterium]|nr:hypothetical protein [Acidimicrobiia bacterium]